MRLRDQTPTAGSRLSHLKRKYGEVPLYCKLALKLYDQFRESERKSESVDYTLDDDYSEVYAPSSKWERQQNWENALRILTRKFIPRKMFEEAGLDPRARELILTVARRWATCRRRAAHGERELTDYSNLRRLRKISSDWCWHCGWNKSGHLIRYQERYTSSDINIAAGKLPSLDPET